MYTTLIEPAQLAALMGEPKCAILDCRFELSQPDWGERAYAAGQRAQRPPSVAER
jgi:hypothetical protein